MRSPSRCLGFALPGLSLLAAGCGGNHEPLELEVPVEIHDTAPAGSLAPNLTHGPDGRVYLSWIEAEGDSAHALRFSTLAGSGWNEPRTIARGRHWFVNWADIPALAVLPDGRLAAHYLIRDPAAKKRYHYRIEVVQSRDGGVSWSAPVVPHRDAAPAEHGFVSLYAAGGDSLGIVWLDGRKFAPEYGGTDETTLRFTTLAGDGGLGPDRALDGRICDCCQTAHAQTARGPLVVYRDRSADDIRDIAVVRRVDGRWTEGRPVHADGWQISACPVNGPAVSALENRVAVAWFTAARDTARVLVAFSENSGARFSEPVRVDAGDPAGRVDVVLLPGGAAVVGWLERTGDAAEVRMRIVTPEGRMGPLRAVAESSGERSSGFPRMARSGDELVVAWTEAGERTRVRTARVRTKAGS